MVKQTLVGPREELGEKSGLVAHQIPGFAAQVVFRVFLAAGRARHSPTATGAWGIPGAPHPPSPPWLQEHLPLRNTSLFLQPFAPGSIIWEEKV